MADTDLLALDEALEFLNMTGSGAKQGERVQRLITSVSRVLDSLCGPIIAREVQQTIWPTSATVILHDWVSWGMTPNSQEQGISELIEYQSGTPSTLTGETLTTAGDFLVVDGILGRRSSFSTINWKGPIAVTYTAGRYSDTGSVDPLFVDAAVKIIAREWPQYAAAWSRGGVDFSATEVGLSYFKSVEPVFDQWLSDERRPSGIA